ncbi:Putative Zinc finger C2H2-type [Colletotrichum destructivum]|uniref:Zinc finger C2H2-type n=1 Tax=Colletotrichum destructivum TaxID=34406 RepID=A0AAX4IUT7_9PEZI|nr:Putative Zinc finger C2H2-type [Colletotrichum destructivum]
MMLLVIRTGPEYVVKLLDWPSKPDRACPNDFTQPTPFINHLAQQVAESTTIYDHHYDPFYQQPSTSETESTYMSAATFNVGRPSNDDTITHFSGANPLLDAMAVTTTGWPYGAQPVSAAPDAMDDNMFQHSPISDFLEMSDESDDWAILMQQDMLVTGAFEMAGFDFPTTMMEETNYQTPDSPEDIFNDPTVQYDIEQSLQTTGLFDFNGLLPDLSASGYLSGTDQVSSYFGSTNASPYEPALDFFPEAAPSPSSIFPASADGSPLGTTTTTSPGSDSAAAHPYRCTTDGCPKAFRKEAQLKQHQRVHRKALVCDICRAERRTEHKFAQVRDLERHLQARHRDVAERANVRSEVRQCPHPGCEHEGRRDNVSRHHRSKHGKELKWKRGVPHVVG